MKKNKKISAEEKFLTEIVRNGKPIVFKNGVYKVKNKKEAEGLRMFINKKP